MKHKTISDHPLVIGEMIERNRIRNARWILRMYRREKLKALWYCAGIAAGAIVVIWLWQPARVQPSRAKSYPWRLEQVPNVIQDGLNDPGSQKPSIEVHG